MKVVCSQLLGQARDARRNWYGACCLPAARVAGRCHRGSGLPDDRYLLPGEGEARHVASTMRRAVAMLDGSADLLDRLAALASGDVAADLGRHAEAIRAIRRQVAGPPRDQWDVEQPDRLCFGTDAGTAD